MSNHYHILIETPDCNLSQGMRHLNGIYTQRFNRRHGRVGHVFQGRFKSILVEKDSYLLELCRYIVLNPVRAGMVTHPEDYRWSSFTSTAAPGNSLEFLFTDWVLAQFDQNRPVAQIRYREFVLAGTTAESPWKRLVGQCLLGEEPFLKKLSPYLREKAAVSEVPRRQRFAVRPPLDRLLPKVGSASKRDLAITKAQRKMKAAGYCRVSSQDQIEGTSLDAQRDQIEAYAKLKGVELLAIFTDKGISGGKPISERPEGRKLVELVEGGEIGAVIVVKLDRAFRNTVDCLKTVEIWEKRGISLHIIDLGGNSVDTNSPAGKFMLTVLAAAAEMERGMIRDRCNSGRKVKKTQGFRIGEIPYGYDLEDPENLDNTRLKENPREQEILCMVQRLHEHGHSLRAIAESLNTQGIQAKKGGSWSYGQVQSLLKTIRRAA